MSKITNAFESKKTLLSGKGITDDEIKAAERALNLSFSGEYKEYLKQYGIAAYSGHELTGLTKSSRLNVVDVTRAEKEKNPGIPSNLYVIECANVEEIVMWQSDDGKIFCSSPNMPLKEFCLSLSEYVLK